MKLLSSIYVFIDTDLSVRNFRQFCLLIPTDAEYNLEI